MKRHSKPERVSGRDVIEEALERAGLRGGDEFPADDSDERDEEDVGPEKRIRALFGQRVMAADKEHGIRAQHLPDNHYPGLLREWRVRRAQFARPQRRRTRDTGPMPPSMPPATNWIPIGPSVVRRGQAAGNPAVSGRAVDIAISPGGLIAYVATANGGVWRTDDGGVTWRSLMDALDFDPTVIQTDTLACGAVAIDPASPDRVYVGTGEGEASIFFNGVFGVVFSYAGVGLLRSDDGGVNWSVEPVAAGSPALTGQAFFQLAVDPTDREHVIAATTNGIYRREPDGAGGYHWVQRRTGNCSSVVVARTAGTTTWFAALRGGTMLSSTDGIIWNALGSSYPTAVTRVSLAVQPTNTGVVYAFSSAGVHRLDVSNGVWKSVTGVLSVSQSDYKMPIAVDPVDINRLYLGGTSMTRVAVSSAGGGPGVTYSMTTTAVGGDAHPDIHRLVIRPGMANELWAATDGGLFRTTSASGAAGFEPRNTGLSTMTCTYLDHHPTEAAVIFCGAQDNGTLRYTGEEAWLHSDDGDGGANVVNWANPFKVIRTYVYGALFRTTDGGQGPGSWNSASPGASGALFYPPLAGTPIHPAAPAEADIIAMGADRTWFSADFGGSWSTPDTTALNGTVSAIAFASANLAYAGTTSGRLYRYTRSGGAWGAGALVGQVGGAAAAGLAPIVTDVIVDPADTTGSSFYVCLGGIGDWRRIWRFDGPTSAWQARSGPSAGASTSVLNVHFNALEADPATPAHLFAGADIGIWRSTDGGANWAPYSEGLPDAGVVDLRLHPTRRLLRVATYGRGVYERDIDATSALGVELYVRDTTLDLGRWPTVDWLANPEDQTDSVRHWAGPNIKVDPPSNAGTYQSSTTQIDFLQFVDRIVDGSDGVATVDASVGTAVNRVYVEVHNRGVQPADNVRVMLLLTNASAGLPALPSGYTANVQSGSGLSTAAWTTVGVRTVNGLRVGVPQVVEFDLPSTMLPPPTALPGQSHYCVLALLHSPDDAFTNTQTGVDALSVSERKAAHRNLHVVEFTGTLPGAPSPAEPSTMWSMIDLHGNEGQIDVLLHLHRRAGAVTLILPKALSDIDDKHVVGGKPLDAGHFDREIERHIGEMHELLRLSRFDANGTRLAARTLQQFIGGRAVRFERHERAAYVGLRQLPHATGARLLLAFDAPKGAKVGAHWDVDVIQAEAKRCSVAGGSTYRCRVVLPRDDDSGIGFAISRDDDEDTVRLFVRPYIRGDGDRPLGEEAGEDVQALSFPVNGADSEPMRLAWEAKREAYVLTLPRRGDRPAARRLTLIARAGGREGRKTIDLE